MFGPGQGGDDGDFDRKMDIAARYFEVIKYRMWNALYDAVLCFGPYHAERLAAFEHVLKIQVGYPRFDAFFDALPRREEMAAELGCDPSRKTVAWLPTWSALSSVSRYYEAVAGLLDRYNVVVKLHPLTASSDPAQVEVLQRLPFTHLIIDHSDSVAMYVIADYMLCDYGGPPFGALYTDRNLLLLNLPGAEDDELTGADSPEILVRQALVNVDPEEASRIAAQLADDPGWAQQAVARRELRRVFFAPFYGYSSQVAAHAIEHLEELLWLG